MGLNVRGLVVTGYGGHAGYAYAVARELSKRGVELEIVVPREYPHLLARFREFGVVDAITLPRKPLEPLYKTLPKWILSLLESLRYARRAYDFILATGSNFSIPPSLVQRLRGVVVYALEDFKVSRPSKAVYTLHRLGARVFLQWPEQLKIYPDGLVVGPVYEPEIYEPRDEGYILVTTGMLGSPELVEAVLSLDYERVVVQLGDLDPEYYSKRKPQWVFFKYTSDIHKWLAGASVVITHTGNISMTARLAYRKPVVLVYTARHSRIHSLLDAKTLAEKINAVFLERGTPSKLREAIERSRKLPVPELPVGAERIAEVITRQGV